MRFRLIGHSCLFAETAAGSILVDPWLSGSCYWRSWWHFPPTDLSDPELAARVLDPDFIYLTHHHFDHFHFPSMRRLPRDAQVLIARYGVDVMAGELQNLGFTRITELSHGEVTDLGHGVRVASYQYGIDDSCFVIDDGSQVIVDVNDCKIRGRSLQQVLDTFGRPTFALKAHSFAQSYPVGYTADDPADLHLVDRQTFLDDFVRVMRHLRPRYAVPFGSMVGFLHPESRHVNDALVTPFDVRDHVEAVGGWEGGECVPMLPGDEWDPDDGFTTSGVDWYGDRPARLAELAEVVRPKVEAALEAEAERHVTWAAFEAYMLAFAHAMPPGVGRFLIDRPICFSVPTDEAHPYWNVSVRHRRVWRSVQPPPGRADVIEVPEAILHDAIRDDILGVVHGGMRIHTHLTAGGAPADLAFWGMVAVKELGYLPSPWTKALAPGGPLLNKRMLGTAWRRRREVLDTVAAMFTAARSGRPVIEAVSEGFGTGEGRWAPGSGAREREQADSRGGQRGTTAA